MAHCGNGNRCEAVRAFKQAVRVDPECADAFLNLGILIVEAGDDRDAEVCLGMAATMDARDTRALEWLAYYYQRSRQWDDARQQLAEAERRAPHAPRVLTARALLELRTRECLARRGLPSAGAGVGCPVSAGPL